MNTNDHKPTGNHDITDSILVDVFGSCVSRTVFLDGNFELKGCADPRIKINYFFDKHPILSCMTPVPNTPVLNAEKILAIRKEELWDKSEHNLRGIQQELLKSTISLISESKAQFFVFDLYDFQTNIMLYDNTMFSPYKYEFFNTRLYQNNKNQFSNLVYPLELPLGLWYGYVKMFMDFIIEKYGIENIILIRFSACSHYISKQKNVLSIPARYINPWTANYRFNDKLRQLEDRIIDEYNPHVIDYSKYYIGDENKHSDLQGAHFSDGYYKESFKKIKEILFDLPSSSLTKKFSALSYDGICNILRIPISDAEYRKMWDIICNPIVKDDNSVILDRISSLSVEEIINNRFFLSNIYAIGESLTYVLHNNLFSTSEKDYLLSQQLLDQLPQPFTSNQKKLLNVLLEGLNDNLLIDCNFDDVFRKFLLLLDHSNVAWVDYLRCMERIEPNHPEVIKYMYSYACAIDDKSLMEKYSPNRRNP